MPAKTGVRLKWFRKIPPKTVWLTTGIFAFMLVFMGVGVWKESEMTLADTQVYGPSEITGSSNEAIAKLKNIINSDNHSFIYFYEPNCELCNKVEPIIFSVAEKKGFTPYRFNLKKYKDVLDLKNKKGQPLVDFYKELPAVAYYNKGWLIAWADGVKSEKTYEEFYDHFRFGDDDGSAHGGG